MTMRTLKTNPEESDRIADNKQNFIFRSSKEHYSVNEIFNFQCYKDKRPIIHRNNKHAYVITVIMDERTAPLEDGIQIIGFRRIA